jgi:hypothetical protein
LLPRQTARPNRRRQQLEWSHTAAGGDGDGQLQRATVLV